MTPTEARTIAEKAIGNYQKYWKAHGVDWNYDLSEKVNSTYASVVFSAGIGRGRTNLIVETRVKSPETPHPLESAWEDFLIALMIQGAVKAWQDMVLLYKDMMTEPNPIY